MPNCGRISLASAATRSSSARPATSATITSPVRRRGRHRPRAGRQHRQAIGERAELLVTDNSSSARAGARLRAGRHRPARHFRLRPTSRQSARRHQIFRRLARSAVPASGPAAGGRPEGRGLRRCRHAVRLQGRDEFSQLSSASAAVGHASRRHRAELHAGQLRHRATTRTRSAPRSAPSCCGRRRSGRSASTSRSSTVEGRSTTTRRRSASPAAPASDRRFGRHRARRHRRPRARLAASFRRPCLLGDVMCASTRRAWPDERTDFLPPACAPTLAEIAAWTARARRPAPTSPLRIAASRRWSRRGRGDLVFLDNPQICGALWPRRAPRPVSCRRATPPLCRRARSRW